MQMWQVEVEEILRKKFPDRDPEELVEEVTKMLDTPVDPPYGDLGNVITEIMKRASEDLKPLTAIYLGFQLGVAWERFNAE